MGGAIALVLASGIMALLCMFFSIICMLASKWRTASVLSIIAALCAFNWMRMNILSILLLIAYPTLVCIAFFFIESTKKKKEQQEEQTDLNVDIENDPVNE